MSDSKSKVLGAIEWRDLTVTNASDVRNFYKSVVGWESSGVSMGEYDDFNMSSPDSGEVIAGICHARGPNADLPAQWLMYVRVADVEVSAAKVVELGGEILQSPRSMGAEKFCLIKDPAGACLGLISV